MKAFDIYNTQDPFIPAPELAPTSEYGRVARQEGKGVIAPQIILKDGRSFYVTANKKKWVELVDAGEVVFSEQELVCLMKACANCDRAGAATLVSGVLDMKNVFGGSRIKRGGKWAEGFGDITPQTA